MSDTYHVTYMLIATLCYKFNVRGFIFTSDFLFLLLTNFFEAIIKDSECRTPENTSKVPLSACSRDIVA